MKTQFKHHIKFGSCWYDNFFKVNKRIQTAKQIELTKGEMNRNDILLQKPKNNERKK